MESVLRRSYGVHYRQSVSKMRLRPPVSGSAGILPEIKKQRTDSAYSRRNLPRPARDEPVGAGDKPAGSRIYSR